MKKQILVIILLAMFVVSCLTLTACHTCEFGEWKVTKQPTCTQDGSKERVCECGEKETEVVSATGHTFGDWAVIDQANCVEAGLKVQVCECGEIKSNIIPATGHSYVAVVTNPTCLEQGYTTHTCEDCGNDYKDTYTDSTGHNYQDGICTACGDITYSQGLVYELASFFIAGEGILDAYSVTGIGSCTDSDILIPGTYNGVPVLKVGENAFENCTNVVSITLPSTLILIESYAFSGCTGLTSITIPNSVTSIGSNAFRDCRSLTSITIPENVTSIGAAAFRGCSCLTNITIEGAPVISYIAFKDTAYYNDQTNWHNKLLYIGNCLIRAENTIKTCSIKEGTKVIASSAFEDCASLISITIPSSVTSISDYAFYGCSSLTSITIPDSVSFISFAAFSNCSSLTSVTIPDSVTSIGDRAFYNCSSLTNITIPESVTTIGDYAFYNCSSLTSITIPCSLTSIGWNAFKNCKNLTSVIFNDPNSWCVMNTMLDETRIDLTNAIQNAAYLTDTYSDYYWYRTN